MKRLACFSVIALGVASSQVTDWTGIYARVDKVVLEPNEQNPQRIQIWGSFIVHKSMTEFSDPISGYLYFTLPPTGDQSKILQEWSDFTDLAYTNEVIALAWTAPKASAAPLPLEAKGGARIRPAEEPPANPEPYKVAAGGVYMVSPGVNYPAMQTLLGVR